jgi:hypothetical protein
MLSRNSSDDETPLHRSIVVSPDMNIKVCDENNIKKELTLIQKNTLKKNNTLKKANPDSLEKQLNDARWRFESNRRMASQLGLTPDIESVIISPVNEVLDENHNTDRREEMGFRRQTFWRSCCGLILDRRATQFFVQVCIGVSVMIFCMAKIWQAEYLHGCTGEDTTIYFSLLSALVGFYIPSPTMNKQ